MRYSMSYTFSFEQLEKAGCSYQTLIDIIMQHPFANRNVRWRKDGKGVDLNNKYIADKLLSRYGVKALY